MRKWYVHFTKRVCCREAHSAALFSLIYRRRRTSARKTANPGPVWFPLLKRDRAGPLSPPRRVSSQHRPNWRHSQTPAQPASAVRSLISLFFPPFLSPACVCAVPSILIFYQSALFRTPNSPFPSSAQLSFSNIQQLVRTKTKILARAKTPRISLATLSL